ncbi:ABC transporter permease [Fodinicurvata fenggangensis]|uniref:ABC transporter permease n=1 Tax=Fodinicurvata fenggangensis TaxID=1121830 RepID=UPI0005548928|nr:ABC transporter permease [Fodinicurvata fenggangensis]
MTSMPYNPATSRTARFRHAASNALGAIVGNTNSLIGMSVFLLIVIAALLAPIFATHDPVQQNILFRLQGPSAEHWMGTDAVGRDIYSRILYGARISLIIGLVSVGLAMIVGTAMGVLAGYYGGKIDQLVTQITDVLLAFPSLILGLMIVAILGPTMPNLIIAIALTTVPQFARVARAPTLSLRERDFIQAGRALGYSDLRIMYRHVLPNIFPEVLVMGSLWLATAIRVEASLAFIGLGVRPPTPTWGGMIRDGFKNILDSPWLAIFPSLAILILVFALNMLGDGLRDTVDPRLKGEK